MTKLSSFSLPVPADTAVSSEFGTRTISDKAHYGIDFAVPKNTPITAVGEGIVIRTIADHYDLGNVIIIKHSDEQVTLYAHLNEIKVREKDIVSSSTMIGYSGNTGSASKGPHLHLEVIEGTGYVNAIKDTKGQSIGITGTVGRVNPRPYLAAGAEDTFSATVSAQNSGYGDLTGDYRDNIMVGNGNTNKMYGLGGDDTYSLPSISGSDQIIDSDFDGKIQINKVTLSGEAQPKTDKDGNEIEGQYSLNGYDLVRSGNDLVITKAGTITNLNRLSGDGLTSAIASVPKFIKQSSKRFIFFIISFFLLATNLSFANNSTISPKEIKEAEVKQKEWDKKLEEFKKFEDPDLKLSIEELRGKYPPNDWLRSKLGDYYFCEEYCMEEENCELPPKNLICRFSVSKPDKSSHSAIRQFILKNFSENQIKSIFVNFGNNTESNDDREPQIVFLTYNYFYQNPISSLSDKEKILASFVFSDTIIKNVFLGDDTNNSEYFSKSAYTSIIDIDDVFYSKSGFCMVIRNILPPTSNLYLNITKEHISARKNLYRNRNIFECINPIIAKKLTNSK